MSTCPDFSAELSWIPWTCGFVISDPFPAPPPSRLTPKHIGIHPPGGLHRQCRKRARHKDNAPRKSSPLAQIVSGQASDARRSRPTRVHKIRPFECSALVSCWYASRRGFYGVRFVAKFSVSFQAQFTCFMILTPCEMFSLIG